MAGTFERSEVRTTWTPAKRTLPRELQRKIDAFWELEVTRTARKSYLFNGGLGRLECWQAEQHRLQLDLGWTSYKELLYSNRFGREITAQFGEACLSRALGISAVLLSSGWQVILIQRSEAVGEFPGKLDVLGGHIDPQEHAVAGVPDPFVAIRAEISEEVGLDLGVNDSLVCLGLIETRATQKPELIFAARTGRSAEQILQRSRIDPCSELTRVFAVAGSPESLADFLLQNQQRLSPSAYGALWLFRQSLGRT